MLFGLWALTSVVQLVVGSVLLHSKNRKNIRKSVLVTGCDHGLGARIAHVLSSRGVRVFAGCLSESGFNSLQWLENPLLVPVLLDVRSKVSIGRAQQRVEAACGRDGLWAIVNNAGILRNGHFEVVPDEELITQTDVNVAGHSRVIRAFLDLLKGRNGGGPGRVIGISSVCGTLAMPGLSGYCASKFALEGFYDGLRRELGSVHGISVILIQPGLMKTPLYSKLGNINGSAKKQDSSVGDRRGDDTRELVPGAEGARVNELLRSLEDSGKADVPPAVVQRSVEQLRFWVSTFGSDTGAAAEAAENAVLSVWPRKRYLVGLDAFAVKTLTLFPAGFVDLVLRFAMPTPVVPTIPPSERLARDGEGSGARVGPPETLWGRTGHIEATASRDTQACDSSCEEEKDGSLSHPSLPPLPLRPPQESVGDSMVVSSHSHQNDHPHTCAHEGSTRASITAGTNSKAVGKEGRSMMTSFALSPTSAALGLPSQKQSGPGGQKRSVSPRLGRRDPDM
uniref:Uncharacterized protein n=1 Tax=Chromera velia CCMP2878 TaxID=1169474 RepID=A0A0G4HK47_9ALVE|eukprot:Cvel_7155.t1-p1 / transcript=Cvel_7155.t1 / gene=Cvel_7155 / organism=Chromera_velia_CCMP2878 / gene_product=Short-chain dehydrogenase/reductase family 9C, putative / transcript_product=Short-chain dehydrogenase/reductase family 9C, putative / location=Cvel_scaffold368:33827-36758(+) / protein_length=507 / sequence_SO=supercontig / SO=protein_coding / is_pseudo=false